MKIVIGSDHAGYELKKAVVEHLLESGNEVVDVGTDSMESCDYPDFAPPVVSGIKSGDFERGILVCGTGLGMSMAANRYAGIRAALVSDLFSAEMSRRHNDSNVLVLSGMITAPPLARKIVDVWLSTEFEGGRHSKRIAKLDQLGDTP